MAFLSPCRQTAAKYLDRPRLVNHSRLILPFDATRAFISNVFKEPTQKRRVNPLGFPIKILFAFMISRSCHMLRHTHPHWSDLVKGTSYETKLLIMQYSSSLPSIFPALCCQKVLFFRMNDQVSIKITTDNYTMHTSYCAGSYCFLRFISVGVHKAHRKSLRITTVSAFFNGSAMFPTKNIETSNKGQESVWPLQSSP